MDAHRGVAGDAGSLAEVKDWEQVLALPIKDVSANRWHVAAHDYKAETPATLRAG